MSGVLPDMRRGGWATALVVLLAMTGCTSTGRAADSPATGPGAAMPGPGSSRQNAGEADRTLASLRRHHDLPLYEMTYLGDYDAMAGLPAPPPATAFGCSLFAAFGDAARPVFARNFDWDPHTALVLRTDPPDGYASLSMVDLHYLGIDGAVRREDRRLLDAPLLPFDGMNERGLAVGLAADDTATVRPEPGRPTVGSVRVLRLVLDEAATVDEAVRVFQRYNLDFVGGPPLHYLLADAGGASAVVEFVDGRMRVQPGRRSWQALTNVPVVDVPEDELRTDHRYDTLATALTAADGRVAPNAALGLLRTVAQGHTRWSVSYDLRAGTARLVAGQDWSRTYEFPLRAAPNPG